MSNFNVMHSLYNISNYDNISTVIGMIWLGIKDNTLYRSEISLIMRLLQIIIVHGSTKLPKLFMIDSFMYGNLIRIMFNLYTTLYMRLDY